VIGANTTTTDSFATAVMTWNVRSWLQLLQENSLDWILIDSQKNIHMTDGFSKKYNLW
jgi:thiamine biosynthesis lipoprotein ApbE